MSKLVVSALGIGDAGKKIVYLGKRELDRSEIINGQKLAYNVERKDEKDIDTIK